MKKLYIGNLPFSATEDQLHEYFSQVGVSPSGVNLIRDRFTGQSRGFAFVELSNDDDAERSINSLNGQNFGGRNLVVNEARPQAERGGGLFQQQCGRCHGANLAGTFETPPLVGRFKPYWSGATMDVLFDYVATAMPLDRPGSLTRAANADILAFILKANGFPTGAKELSASSEDLKAIRFDAVRPPPETPSKSKR